MALYKLITLYNNVLSESVVKEITLSSSSIEVNINSLSPLKH